MKDHIIKLLLQWLIFLNFITVNMGIGANVKIDEKHMNLVVLESSNVLMTPYGINTQIIYCIKSITLRLVLHPI